MLLTIIAGLAGAAEPVTHPDQDAPLLTAEEGAAVDAVLDQAITLGFPEVRGAQWHESRVPFFGPVDLELPGGGWLLGGWDAQPKQFHATPSSDAAHVWSALAKTPRADTAWGILRVDAQELARLQRTAVISLNGLLSDTWPGWDGRNTPRAALPGAVLRRCGAQALGDRLLLQAQYQHTRAEHRLCFSYDESGRIGGYETPAQRWDERLANTLILPYEHFDHWDADEHRASAHAPALMPLIPLATVLRRECHWWFRQRLTDADAAHAVSSSAAALTILDEDDRKRVADDIALLAARAAVPIAPAADAPLAFRLAAWSFGPFGGFQHGQIEEWNRITRLSPEEYRDQFLVSTSSARERWRRQYDDWVVFQSFAGDADGLIGLLGSTASCRWLEGGTPRLLGDNALRALTLMWSVDPRLLVGRDRFAPWDEAERAATAAAVQALWRKNGQQGIAATIRDAVGGLPPWSLRRIHARASAPERASLDAAISAAWREGPSAPRDRQEQDGVEAMFAELGSDPALAATIRSWPVHGTLAHELLLVHELAGDGAPLDAHLRRVLAGAPDQDDARLAADNGLTADLSLIRRRGNASRVHMLLDYLARDPATDTMASALEAVCTVAGTIIGRESAFEEAFLDRSTADSRPLLLWAVLADVRGNSATMLRGTAGESPVPADLRVCDAVMEELRLAAEKTGATDHLPSLLTPGTGSARCSDRRPTRLAPAGRDHRRDRASRAGRGSDPDRLEAACRRFLIGDFRAGIRRCRTRCITRGSPGRHMRGDRHAPRSGMAVAATTPPQRSEVRYAMTSRSSAGFRTKPIGGIGETGGVILAICAIGMVCSLLSAVRSSTSLSSCLSRAPLSVTPSFLITLAMP